MSTKKPTKPIRSKIPPPVANKTTPFRGVNWYARGECWMVQIQSQEAAALGIKSHLGYYATDEAAAEAWNEAVRLILESRPMDGPIGHGSQLRAFRFNITRVRGKKPDHPITGICRTAADIPENVHFGKFSSARQE